MKEGSKNNLSWNEQKVKTQKVWKWARAILGLSRTIDRPAAETDKLNKVNLLSYSIGLGEMMPAGDAPPQVAFCAVA